MLAHNNAGAHRPHTSLQPYDSMENLCENRPQPYQVPIRSNRIDPAVSQDNPQYAEPRLSGDRT